MIRVTSTFAIVLMGAVMMGCSGGDSTPVDQSLRALRITDVHGHGSTDNHITWSLEDQTDLTAVELWRRLDEAEYSLIMTLGGELKTASDTDIASPGRYCYKVRAVRGEEKSEFSNERCRTKS